MVEYKVYLHAEADTILFSKAEAVYDTSPNIIVVLKKQTNE